MTRTELMLWQAMLTTSAAERPYVEAVAEDPRSAALTIALLSHELLRITLVNGVVGTAIAGASWLAWRVFGTPPPWAALWWFVSLGTTAVNVPITLVASLWQRRSRPLAAVARDPAVLRFGGGK